MNPLPQESVQTQERKKTGEQDGAGEDRTFGYVRGLEFALREQQIAAQLMGGQRPGGKPLKTPCPPSLCHGTQWVRLHSNRTAKSSSLYAVSVLSRYITTSITPGKVYVIVLEAKYHVVSVG